LSEGLLREIFGYFGADLDSLCFTQHQVICLFKKNRELFTDDGTPNAFLCKSKNSYYVVMICFSPEGWYVDFRWLSNLIVWRAQHFYRFFVPKR